MNLLQSIGKTPLIRLTKLTEGLDAEILVKVESRNPGGSIKDRAAHCRTDQRKHRHRLGGRIHMHGVQAYPDDAGIHE